MLKNAKIKLSSLELVTFMAIEKNPQKQKKAQGVFYTPYHVAKVLCDWAIQTPTDSIMEPSFGGCDFLKGARSRFLALGGKDEVVLNGLYGCDIDPDAFNHLKEIVPNHNGHFIQDDFMHLSNAHFPKTGKFDVVLGNPPYVSHHNMSDHQKESISKWLEKTLLSLDGRASLWAYFVLHSLSFLRDGGRMAWILPGSFLYSDYAKDVRNILESQFQKLLGVQLGERLFLAAGTEEISIVLIGDGYDSSAQQQTNFDFIFTTYVKDLPGIIQEWDIQSKKGKQIQATSKNTIFEGKNNLAFQTIANNPSTHSLSDLLEVRIGIVSGANHFFILDEDTWSKYKLPQSVRSDVLTTFKLVQGITFTDDDLKGIRENKKPCMLVDTTKASDIHGKLKTYLDSFPVKKRETTTTFQRRIRSGVWHRFNDGLIPDAFFPYMQNNGPQIALNEAGINSTNSVHRLYFKEGITDLLRKLIAISILSTFSQLSAEFEGRVYGAGVLKHEPSEVMRIQAYIPREKSEVEINQIFQEINLLIRAGNRDQAQIAADRFLFKDFNFKATGDGISVLINALEKARNRRFPQKGQSNE